MTVNTKVFRSLEERGECSEPEKSCLEFLDKTGLSYEGITHDRADTIEDCLAVETILGAKIAKNLFLCNSQKTAFHLLIMPGDKFFKTKFLSKQINSARLSFADAESMEKHLGLRPGSVSVFGLMNDRENAVNFIVDKDLLKNEYIGFHPCLNTSTLKIKLSDVFDVFLPALKKEYVTVDLPRE